MPAYGTLATPSALYSGDSALAFNAEQPATGVLSERYALAPSIDGLEVGLTVTFTFSGVPGAFEFDVYESEIDLLNNFIDLPTQSKITAVNANNVGRIDITPFFGNFIAIYCKTQSANAVNATVRITRRG